MGHTAEEYLTHGDAFDWALGFVCGVRNTNCCSCYGLQPNTRSFLSPKMLVADLATLRHCTAALVWKCIRLCVKRQDRLGPERKLMLNPGPARFSWEGKERVRPQAGSLFVHLLKVATHRCGAPNETRLVIKCFSRKVARPGYYTAF